MRLRRRCPPAPGSRGRRSSRGQLLRARARAPRSDRRRCSSRRFPGAGSRRALRRSRPGSSAAGETRSRACSCRPPAPSPQCAVTSVASMFSVIVSGRAPASHTRARAAARAARIRSSSCSSIDFSTRWVVVSDALAPNSRSWPAVGHQGRSRNRRRRRASPPRRAAPGQDRAPSAARASRPTPPTARRSARTDPTARPATRRPACDTSPSPSAVTSTVPRRAAGFTNRVSSWVGYRDFSNPDSHGPGGRSRDPSVSPTTRRFEVKLRPTRRARRGRPGRLGDHAGGPEGPARAAARIPRELRIVA